MTDAAKIARGLTKAQRQIIAGITRRFGKGA